MELHQLRYAAAIAKYQNFTRAAQELCLSQPSLSQQITKLETELGVKLFERNTRNITLTSAGKILIERSQHILSEIEEMQHAIQEHAALLKGKFNIGVIPVVGKLKLSSLITAFQKTQPDLDIHIIEGGSCVLFEYLCQSKIEAAFLTPPITQDTSMVTFHPLIDDELVLVVPCSQPFTQKECIDLAEASQERFILPNSTTSAYGITMHACRAAGFEPKAACECSQVETVMGLISDGVGIALLSSRVAASYAEPDVRIIRITNSPSKSIALATLKHTRPLPVVTAFRNFALDWVQQHSSNG